MMYTNSNVRRQDRLLNEELATSLLVNGEYGVLSMNCVNDGVYGLPINYVWDHKHYIYLHGAPEGKKLECIKNNPNVSFCIIGKTNVISKQFTTEYESIILSCTAAINLPEEERMKAILLIIEKYAPNDKKIGAKYAEKSFHRTEIIRLDIKSWSGKTKKIKP